MKSTQVFKSLFVVSVIVVVLLTCDRGTLDYERVKRVRLYLSGLILPGRTTSDSSIVVKFIWQGGG